MNKAQVLQSTKRLALTATAAGIALCVSACAGDTAAKKQTKVVPAPPLPPPITQTAKAQTPAPAAPKPEPAKAAQPDAAAQLIERVESQYQAGESNYRAGHLEAAKQNFDTAVDMLLTSKLSLKSDPRLMAEFEKVVEHVNGMEMAALKQGDGFTEQHSVPAPIDEANDVTFPVDPNVRAEAQRELSATSSDLPLVMNDYVASYISMFSSPRGRPVIERALVRAGRYRAMIERVLREEGVPQDLIYLAQAESGFQPMAVSRVGARGMWQFMASRAAGYGLQRNWWIDERQDPEKSTRAAARHLKDLYNQFGDWYLAIAAYNSGPGNVQYGVEKTGYADFWELYRRSVLPAETKNYVPIILAMTIMAKNPQQYGLDKINLEQPLEIDTVRVDYPVDLRLVAEAADVPIQQLMDLNPSLLRLTTPKDAVFDLHLPAGTKDRYVAAISAIPVDKRVSWRYHRVQPGDSLSAIARKYHTSTDAIAEANNMSGDEPIANTKLVIPMTGAKAPSGVAASYSKRATHYDVRRGDTVLSVADDFGVPADRVRRWNHLRGNTLKPGRTVLIYRPVLNASDADEAAEPRMRTTSASRRSSSRHRSSSSTGAKHASKKHHE
ncbi:MAG TPA: transglycosylase SLT domain-containing protein [Terriglobales bacterium]